MIPAIALPGCLWPRSDTPDENTGPTVVEGDGPDATDVGSDSDLPSTREVSEGENEEDTIFARRPERLIVELEVHRIEAPAGVFGEDSPLWKIASVPIASAAVQLRLRSNGFLAAVGRDSDRPDLVSYMESLPKPAIATDRVQPDSARLIDIEIGRHKGNVTLFHLDESGTLRGLELEDPTVRFRMRVAFRSANLRDIWLEVTPELEEPPGQPKWEIGPDERARLVPQERKHTFKSVTFGVEVPHGGFLLLGAASDVYTEPLLARPFFLTEIGKSDDGRQRYRESVYVIRPIIRAVTTEGKNVEKNEAEESTDGNGA